MRYWAGQDIREGDEVWVDGLPGSGRVVDLIRPGTPEARHWSAPDGGVLIERDGAGLTLKAHPEKDADLILVRRRG